MKASTASTVPPTPCDVAVRRDGRDAGVMLLCTHDEYVAACGGDDFGTVLTVLLVFLGPDPDGETLCACGGERPGELLLVLITYLRLEV